MHAMSREGGEGSTQECVGGGRGLPEEGEGGIAILSLGYTVEFMHILFGGDCQETNLLARTR